MFCHHCLSLKSKFLFIKRNIHALSEEELIARCVEDDAPESCQAYFTTQLQFDIRELKNRFNGSIKINIGQYTISY
jgi:hypothetical protein